MGQEQGVDDLVSLSQEKVAVVGAGRMARLLLQHLQSKGARSITVVNRTVAKAEALAKDFPDLVITCCGLDQLDAQLAANTLLSQHRR